MPTGSNTVYGPVQVNSTILNTDTISEKFTLLDQKGSHVQQGSLQLVPIDDSLLYIRPIYVVSETQNQPAFRFVVVFYNGKAVIDTTVEKALSQFPAFQGLAPTTPTTPGTPRSRAGCRRPRPSSRCSPRRRRPTTTRRTRSRPATSASTATSRRPSGTCCTRASDAPPRPRVRGVDDDHHLAVHEHHDDHRSEGLERRFAGPAPQPLEPLHRSVPEAVAPLEKARLAGLFEARGIVTIYVVEIPGRPRPELDPRSLAMAVKGIDLGKYQLGWSDTENYVYKPKKGVNADVVKDISWHKSELDWMTQWRLNALKRFERKPMLEWFSKNMADIDFDDIYYYIKPTEGVVDNWDMLPEEMKNTYEKLGIPEAERKFLAGVTSQYESEVVYHKNRDDLAEKGIFTSMDQALIDYPDLVKEHLGTVIPPGDNKFAGAKLRGVVGRQLHLRPARRPRRHAAPGLLPHQRGERGPVRAHADHRRRGFVGALRRGLLRSGVVRRLAALCGRRAHRGAEPRIGTPRSRTGPRTSTTSSPSGRGPRPRPPSSGSTATWARSSR